MTGDITISCIIPTFNGKIKLANILAALTGQTLLPHEVIVIIDGSSDGTDEWLNEQATYYNHYFTFTYINNYNKGRAASRNNGAERAKNNLLIFFDDDMRPEPDCIREHVTIHSQLLKPAIIVGNVLEDYSKSTSEIQKYKAYLSRKWMGNLPEFPQPINAKTPFLTAANFSISKQLFKQLGCFDTRLTDAEDFDLACRAMQQNIPVYYQPKALAWHDDLITCRGYIKRQQEYQKAQQVLMQLKPEWKAFKADAQPEFSFLKRMVFKIAQWQLWPWFVDYFNIFKSLPKKLRYKIYDIIITAGKYKKVI